MICLSSSESLVIGWDAGDEDAGDGDLLVGVSLADEPAPDSGEENIPTKLRDAPAVVEGDDGCCNTTSSSMVTCRVRRMRLFGGDAPGSDSLVGITTEAAAGGGGGVAGATGVSTIVSF